ncbi:MAG TPA: M28 family peptidase [Thermoanaerobaculia bacterium]
MTFIPAYSEFMPPPHLPRERVIRDGEWLITEYEEALELQPGLQRIGEQLIDVLSRLGRGEPARGIDGRKLDGNPCWPDDLRKNGAPANERYVLLMPLALSRTQDDKGRIRWTLFGASEHGPERAFRGVRKKFYDDLAREVYGENAKYLATFTPFAQLPKRTRDAYLAGDLHLLPFPGSLLFFHAPGYHTLARELPTAMQIPLLYSIERNEAPHGIRVTQSGWMHEHETASRHGPFRNTVKRTNRWTRVHRHEDELPVLTLEQKVTHTLFSSAAEDLGLYGKPMARNSQVWTDDYRLLLDGPSAGRDEIAAAIRACDASGAFGYRFFYPPMRVDGREVVWHRPLVDWDRGGQAPSPVQTGGAPVLHGFVLAGDTELAPHILSRDGHREILSRFAERPRTLNNARKILDTYELIGEKLEPSFARALLRTSPEESLDEWVTRKEIGHIVEPLIRRSGPPSPRAAGRRLWTFADTATRAFETRYWRTIARLAHGTYLNKDNADVVLDRATQRRLVHKKSDLWRLGDHLLAYYKRLGIECEADSFAWETDFDFPWSKGWLDGRERNIIAKIPGRDRSRVVIMADHYDTAYMEDVFGRSGKGPRIAAAGADDNHSATAALMLAAPIFRELDLACDIWLVHLTGEEFPADCLGARHLCERIVDEKLDIAAAFVLDMVAHNNDKARDIFQICPGWGREAMLLARTAHEANVDWNASIDGKRKSARRGKRSKDPRVVPQLAKHLKLHGDVRPASDAHSTLYNTDGQIFSDTGVPVVLFMENYDIDRHGYHDSRDTMANIDLDYGAALVSIAIETVARTAGATTASSNRPRSRGAAASRRGRRRSR